MNQTSTWPAPAKLNLFLYINGQLDNDYHELQTLFQFLDYSDQLHFRIHESQKINLLNAIDTVKTKDNLIYRAAKLLQEYSESPLGVDIEVEKVLPMGGGLGGGSSNAATTLVALNHLWNLHLPTETLMTLGIQLGADVPIFVKGQSAIAEGIGEKLRPIACATPWYLVVKPPVHVSTALIFQHPKLPRNTPKRNDETLLASCYENDCEKLVRELFPEVDKALLWLLEYAPSRLTGTGACVFAEFNDEAQAHSALTNMPNWLTGFVARGCNESPLLTKLKAQAQ